jgi:hypothetical protein
VVAHFYGGNMIDSGFAIASPGVPYVVRMTHHDLATFLATTNAVYDAVIHRDASGAWHVSIKSEQHGKECLIETVNGEIRAWSGIANALNFISRNFPNAREVFLDTAGRRRRRQADGTWGECP